VRLFALSARSGWILAAAFAATVVAALIPGVAAAKPPRLATALFDQNVFAGDSAELGFRRTRAAGARYVRLLLYWRTVAPAPDGERKPAQFDAANPHAAAYRWGPFDRQIRLAVEAGLTPFVDILVAPNWAEDRTVNGNAGTRRPDPSELAAFATAAARRYSGRNKGLPRVRLWQAWNEPNLSAYLTPQFIRGRPAAADWYRRMVNEFTKAVKGVDPSNTVIAGGLSPFTFKNPESPGVAPMLFMRRFLCLARRGNGKSCDERVSFDVWSHHPYTTGGPTHHAASPYDVSLGDLGDMQRVLRMGSQSIDSRGPVRFWVTEFSWDSNPPDPKGVPVALHARWVAEALYRMWNAGIELVTWFTLRDDPFTSTPYQSGLYFNRGPLERDRAKPALAAFRFPFVAFPRRGGVFVWGRSPSGSARLVVEYRQPGDEWRRIGTAMPNRSGIFTARIPLTSRSGWVRARASTGGAPARGFSLRDPGDQMYFPFGSN
jgi:hypothetical protein